MKLQVDMPFDEKDAKRRGIDPTLSRLIFGARAGSQPDVDTIAELMFPSARGGEENLAFVKSLGEFATAKSLLSSLRSRDIVEHPEASAVVASNVAALADVLKSWEAEILVIVIGSGDRLVDMLSHVSDEAPRWWKFVTEGHEVPFLRQLDLCDPVGFYSRTRASLELIGTSSAVLARAEQSLVLIRGSQP